MSSENGCSHYEWCTEDQPYGCAFPPTMLKRMLEMFESDPRAGYNEVVVDPEHMHGNRGCLGTECEGGRGPQEDP